MACLPWLVLSYLWQALAKKTSSTLHLDNTGQINFDVISHDSNFLSATGGFGTLNISHKSGTSSDAVGLFMDGIEDPSMYMRSPNIGADNPPSELEFMVHGNLTTELNGVKASCGELRIGKFVGSAGNLYWFLSSKHCVKGLPPEGGKDGQYRFVCECDGGMAVMFSQPGKDKLAHHVPMNIYDCSAIMDKAGQWVEVASSPGAQTLTYGHGVEHGESVTDSKTWGHSTTASVSTGFHFLGISIGSSVSHMTSVSFTNSHASTFSMSDTESYTTQIGAGTVWQFQMGIKDNCGLSVVKFNDLQLTQSGLNPPCCLPGYFVNISHPEGECLEVDGEKYDVCDRKGQVLI